MLLGVHMFAPGSFRKHVNKQVSALSLSQEWLVKCDSARGYTFAFWVPYPFPHGWGSIVFCGPTAESRQLQRHCDSEVAQRRIPESLPWYEYQEPGVRDLQ